MLESAAPPLAHEFTAPKAAPSATSSERTNGRKNFTSLPPSVKGGSIDDIVSASVRESEEYIAAAKAKAGKTASVESPPLPPMSKPMAPEVSQQLPPGVSPEAFARLEGQVANKSKTMEQAQAELEQMVTKAIGVPPDEVKPPTPMKKTEVIEKTVATPSPKTTSTPSTTSTESKFPALQKIKNMFGKVWDSISAFFKGITSWVTK